jgi:xylulokinase
MIVGIDIGTQSLKAVAVDRDLRVRGEAGTPYRPSLPRAGWAEQSPALWEQALAPTIAGALTRAGTRLDAVEAIGISGQLDGCIPVDDGGRPLGPCIIWMDRRAQAEMAGLPADLIRARTGIVPDASHMAAKIRWLKRRPGEARARRFHQPVSYMVERLTGEAVIDHALASTSMLYALDARDYDDALLGLFEVERRELPELRDAATRAGSLNARGADLTGVPRGTPVAVGTGDDFAAPLGAGITGPGPAAVVLGTGEVVGAVHGSAAIDPADLVETHAYPAGGYFIENPGWLAGGAVAWLAETLALGDVAELDRLAGAVPAGAEGVIFLPALTGAMAPEWTAAARGCFYGLTPSHGRGHLARAVLEGCAFAMRDVVERLRAIGARVDSLSLLGGGAQSRLWAQIRADAVGLPATLPRHRHTSALGAAMLAAVACGAIESLDAAAAQIAGPAGTIAPDARATESLDHAYRQYRRLFESLRPMFDTDGRASAATSQEASPARG